MWHPGKGCRIRGRQCVPHASIQPQLEETHVDTLARGSSPIVRFELVMASSFAFASSSHHMEYSSISLDSFSRSEATLQPMRCLPHRPPVIFCDLQDSSAFQWKRADPQLSLHADFRKKISERKELRIAVEAQLNYEPPQTPALTFPFSSSNS